jgi:hypothetical protein
MNPKSSNESIDQPINESEASLMNGIGENAEGTQATALQQAIRMRSIDTLNADQTRPGPPLSQRLLILGLTLAAMLIFVLMINFIVTGVQKIMDVWYPGTISGEGMKAAPPVFDPKQPIYISVDPPADQAPSSNQSDTTSSSTVSR